MQSFRGFKTGNEQEARQQLARALELRAEFRGADEARRILKDLQ